MQQVFLRVDAISTWFGKLFAWSIVILTLVIGFEVVSRYFFNSPHAWVFDATYMLYGVLFMMAGAYTLARRTAMCAAMCFTASLSRGLRRLL
jgi:TRAP-type mannitol/chloroaromatic compound transport system permease small subunit